MPGRAPRAEFSENEDIFLTKFIATYNPGKQGRGGNTLYQRLVQNVDGKWNWSKTHSWQSWRNRYAKNSDEFDRKIRKYQIKKGIDPQATAGKDKPASPPPDGQEGTSRVRSKRAGDQISSQQRKAKRARLETNHSGSGRSRLPPVEAEPTSPLLTAGITREPSPSYVQRQTEAVSDVLPSTRQPESKLNIPPLLPARSGTLPLPSSPSDSPLRIRPPTTSQLPPSSQPLASSSQQAVTPKLPPVRKLILKPKPKPVSPLFRSFSPTPDHSTPPRRTLVRVVEDHFTTSLADRLGHARLGYRSESEEGETKAWPPVQGKKNKEKEVVRKPHAASSPAVQGHGRRPLNRTENATTRPARVLPKPEPKDQRTFALHRLEPDHHPFSQVSLPPPPPPPHDRPSADVAESPLKHRSTGKVYQLVQNLQDRKRDIATGPSTSGLTSALPLVQPVAGPSNLTSVAVPSGSTSSAEMQPERAVAAPGVLSPDRENTYPLNTSMLAQNSARPASSTITSVPQIQPLSKGDPTFTTSVYPAVPLQERSAAPIDRSNIQSLPEPKSLFVPFNENKSKGKVKRRDTDPPLTHAQRLLTRGRKQRRRETLGAHGYDDVPSIDLTRALSAASTSRIPYSKGSTSSSVSRLLHRYSLPAHSTPSAVPGDLSGYLTTLDQPGPSILPIPPAFIMRADVPLSASVGFSTLISRIAAAHGYTPSVVLEVYKRLGSLKDAEEFVRAMRNATEGWVEAEFERREQEARGASRRQHRSDSSDDSEGNDDAPRVSHSGSSFKQTLAEHRTPNGLHVQYIPPPDESEYEPPPTSRAARWKRVSMGKAGGLSASWGTIATGRRTMKDQEATEDMVDEAEDATDNSEGDDNASGEEDEKGQDDLERAEEETVAEELIPESPPERLQEEDAFASKPEQDAEEETEPAYEEHSSQDDHQDPDHQYHEFSQVHDAAHEGMVLPMMHGTPEHTVVPNEGKVVGDDSLDIPHSWNKDEDRALLSANWEMLKVLERQRGKWSMRQRVVQLLR